MFEFLEWDSNFFGFKVLKASNEIKEIDLKASLSAIFEKEKATLVYYSTKNKIQNLEELQEDWEIHLVDQKVTYVKSLQKREKNMQGISSYNENYPSNKLIDLSIQAGIYSRFNIDPQIEKEKFKKLYKIWIINSVSKKIAKEVLVIYKSNQIAGFVTLGEKNNVADIGLIAVDNNFRGKGIGKSLMLGAENWFIENTDLKKIQVVTQNSNKPACQLYSKLGYFSSSVDYFYHIWAKQNF